MYMIKPIRSEEDYKAACVRMRELMGSEAGTPAGDELDVLADLVSVYEDRHYPSSMPSAIDAIEFRMEQAGLTRRDLIPYIGSRQKVSDILTGKRDITMAMARALHKHLGIPAEVLLQEPGAAFDSTFEEIEPRRFPLKEMAKRGWIDQLPDLIDRAQEVMRAMREKAGEPEAAAAPLYRANGHRRINAKTDPYALKAWCWRVLGLANESPPQADYRPGTVTEAFMREVAQLSVYEDGPRRAQEHLAEHGISLVIERHLPRTHLDGAALCLQDGRPVIGLTLRYDRIDSFWFSLMHELAHVGLHLDCDENELFIDDLSLSEGDKLEDDADKMARGALIPPEMWEFSAARDGATVLAVYDLAQEAGVHPAVVAGRVRHERGNYRLLSQLVGSGKVRSQFGADASSVKERN
ncbi:MAG: ImmA/IrrE family metallo-endopeptidase [Caldilineaceae bacterium]|nr:ImmA/IrrE family metallo-endopeptidase [Caldilineaceae bacterium]